MDDRERKTDSEGQQMTIKDAIFVLNSVEAHGICIEAKKMAIQSLEAWEKVKDEINSMPNIIYRWDAVEIIDKHLSEVENE